MTSDTVVQLLISQGALSLDQLQQAEQDARITGQKLLSYLIENKKITPEQLARARAEHAGFAFVDQITDNMADIELLAKVPLAFLRDYAVMPILKDGTMVIATADPAEFEAIDQLSLLLNISAKPVVIPKPIIIEAINRYYPLEGASQLVEELEEEDKELEAIEFADVEEKDIVSMAAEAPIIKLVNHILFQAVKRGASDIHIEPYEKELVVRYRIDGVLYPVMRPPKRLQGALISRLKIMANLNIAEKRVPQDGRIDIKVAGKPFDIRVSILPTSFGERVVMRLLDKSRSSAQLEHLDFSRRDLRVLLHAIAQPNGIIYVTGPTGSGKTTTLYSILSKLNTPEVNIITVEDPVEYQVAGIGQVQVRTKVGLTFASALRSILRQDPDICMIGETRDQETAQIAVQAALTGHLVLSTLHTNSAPATITRLIDMGVEPFLIASSIKLVMAQRLVRRLCSECKAPYTPEASLLRSIGITPEQAKKMTFYKPIGCQECLESGYKGRLAVFELMEMTAAIAQLTMERADSSRIGQQAMKDGMTPLVEDGVRKIVQGLTTIEEVLSVATFEQQMDDVYDDVQA